MVAIKTLFLFLNRMGVGLEKNEGGAIGGYPDGKKTTWGLLVSSRGSRGNKQRGVGNRTRKL